LIVIIGDKQLSDKRFATATLERQQCFARLIMVESGAGMMYDTRSIDCQAIDNNR
jgi:hypothetical protein